MGKAKTHQGANKRFRVTGSGRLLRRRQMSGHFRAKKSGSRLRSISMEVPVSAGNMEEIARMLPYRRKAR